MTSNDRIDSCTNDKMDKSYIKRHDFHPPYYHGCVSNHINAFIRNAAVIKFDSSYWHTLGLGKEVDIPV